MKISQAELHKLLNYNPATGIFTWAVSPRYGVSVGDQPGSVETERGHLQIRLKGQAYKAHRLAWFYVHGAWPEHEIDHINENKLDNRIANLRDVCRSANQHNMAKPKKHNKLGVKGVYSDGYAYVAQIQEFGKNRVIGRFKSIDQASAAYQEAKAAALARALRA